MPPRKRKAGGLAVQVTLTVGAPILPYGVAMECTVPSNDVPRAYAAMVALARMMDEAVKLRPDEKPRADNVPGGPPVHGDDEFFDDEPDGAAGVPSKIGFGV